MNETNSLSVGARLRATKRYSGALALLFVLATMFTGCITRTEVDYYTLTLRDTTYHETVRNTPGSNADHGVVFPSTRDIRIERQTTSLDSSNERRYPDFLRFGGIEIAGLVGTSSSFGIGTGVFGLFALLDSNRINAIGNSFLGSHDSTSKIFKGLLFRFMPMEYRLRWFDDSPNWTIGTSIFELFAGDEKSSSVLTSFSNVYIRKRYWVRDRIPYVIVTPFVGFSLLPSAYVNLGAEAQLGSFGGFNLRGYLGYINGFNWGSKQTVNFPYIGLGVSALDFTNRVEETERQWKDYVHSAVEVSALEIGFLNAFNVAHNAFDSSFHLPITGGYFRLATAHFPLPFLDHHFWIGTSLINLMALGFAEYPTSFLPIRIGWRKYLIAEDLSFEPSLELNYYPSQYANLGLRLRLDTFSGYTLSLIGGYAYGTTGAFLPSILYTNGSGLSSTFSTVYLGISFGVKDYLLKSEVVEAQRATEH
ncbi:MAG: hypothetical protein ABI444_13110 [Candidatus Kapaibacterium sp.]|jgi:hypothetical protein